MTDQSLRVHKRLLNNTVLLTAGEITGQAVNFIFVIGLARGYGREMLGIYAFSMAVGAVLCLLMSFGTHKLLLRDLSRAPEKTTDAVGALLVFQAILGALLLLGVHEAARRLGASGPQTAAVVTLVVSFHLLTHLGEFMTLGFDARQRMGPRAAVQAGPRIGMLLLGGMAMFQGASAEVTLASMPVAALLTLLLIYAFAAQRFGHPGLRLRPREIRAYLQKGLPFFSVVMLTALYTRLGIIYLALLAGEAEAGLFAAAERLVVAAGVVHMMFGGALFPLLARLWGEDHAGFREMVHRATRVILFITLPMATLMAVFAADLIGLLYGDPFREAGLLLAAVSVVLVLRGIALILTITSIAANRQGLVVITKTIGIAVLSLLCLLLVPAHGAMGLVAAMLLSELAAIVGNYLLLRRSGLEPVQFATGARVLWACLLAAGLAYLGADLGLWQRAGLVAGGGALALWGLGAVRLHDLAYLRAILASRGH